jgi:hypothetical protein
LGAYFSPAWTPGKFTNLNPHFKYIDFSVSQEKRIKIFGKLFYMLLIFNNLMSGFSAAGTLAHRALCRQPRFDLELVGDFMIERG